MKIQLFDAPPLKGDPWEEDCCGAHNGQAVELSFNFGEHNLTLRVTELITGIGNVFVLNGQWQDQKCEGTICVDDGGELLCQLQKKIK